MSVVIASDVNSPLQLGGSLAALKNRGYVVVAETPEFPELPEVGGPPQRLLLSSPKPHPLLAAAATETLPEIPVIRAESLLGAGGIVDLPDITMRADSGEISDLLSSTPEWAPPYRLTTIVKNPCQVESWRTIPLVYSLHAQERCTQRHLPKFDRLPADARLVDVDEENGRVYAVCFKIQLPIPPDVLAREAREKAKRQEQRRLSGREPGAVSHKGKQVNNSGPTRADFGIFLILATNGLVITTFKKDEEYQRWRHRKERKRQHLRYV